MLHELVESGLTIGELVPERNSRLGAAYDTVLAKFTAFLDDGAEQLPAAILALASVSLYGTEAFLGEAK